jgi:ribulose-bisphosphate carboxylase small chain
MSETMAYKVPERRGETFSYLPPMTPDRLRKQVAYLIAQGWSPAIEYTEPEKAFSSFWYLWKLPFFGEKSVERIMSECESCHRANPGMHVRLIGYDNYAQSQGTAFIVYRAGAR